MQVPEPKPQDRVSLLHSRYRHYVKKCEQNYWMIRDGVEKNAPETHLFLPSLRTWEGGYFLLYRSRLLRWIKTYDWVQETQEKKYSANIQNHEKWVVVLRH